MIVFNGEIYNFKKLKAELSCHGVQFSTDSDTEVILNLYREYGIDKTLELIEGMFSFAIYDVLTRNLYLARDKFGEKPCYVWNQDGKLRFASELKAFAPVLGDLKIDYTALNYFLSVGYIPAPYTIYQEIEKLLPGHYWNISPAGAVHKKCYYNLCERVTEVKSGISFQQAKENLRKMLTESVRERMISDVPSGAFLSGGIDSSIVCTLMSRLSDKPVNTFSIGFKERDYDESDRARIVAKYIGANHTQYILDYDDVVDDIDDIVAYYDEPFGDSSAIPSFYVAKLARQKVKVVLTGDCADEIFAGYEKYLGRYYVRKINKLPGWVTKMISNVIGAIPCTSLTNNFLRKAKKVLSNSRESDFDIYYNLLCQGFSDEARKRLFRPQLFRDIKQEIENKYDSFHGLPVLTKEQCTDVNVVLEGGMFVKVDRACMKNSLENRSPFIDSRIVEFALSLPPGFKQKGRMKKYILKETFKDILPKKTYSFSKRGFAVPVDYWFRNELRSKLEEVLAPDFVERQGIFDYDEISQLVTEHMSGKGNHKVRLWNLYVFQKWWLRNNKS